MSLFLAQLQPLFDISPELPENDVYILSFVYRMCVAIAGLMKTL